MNEVRSWGITFLRFNKNDDIQPLNQNYLNYFVVFPL